ncbi:mechanosensitive ion channel protein 10-like [Ricinus communis]|uniref:mechanosensitive ion channel protein 10-like n=1 Tax=Ricinus communis TaxID=3988 RepID=UPI000D689015|nr:mechanosensitive ion channel protein 10-like [Ricinus communis]|eukprot:XP_025012281.1 mechanosensitive ion channel protein 10-like [Ricinus communis]
MAEEIQDYSINIQYVAQQATLIQNAQAVPSNPQSTDRNNDNNVAKDSDSSIHTFKNSQTVPATPKSITRRNLQTSSVTTSNPDRSGNGNPATCKGEVGGSEDAKVKTEGKESEEKGRQWRLLVFIVFMESTIFVCSLCLLIASLRVDRLNNSVLWDLGIWKWCLLIISILCGRLIAYLLTKALLFLIWMLWLDERVLYFAYGVRKSFMVVIWVGLVTLAWGLLCSLGIKRSEDTTKILHDVTRGLGGCLIGATLWLFKTLFVKLVGSLHAQKLFDKIKEAIRLRKALLALSVSIMAINNTDNSDKYKQDSVPIRVRKFIRFLSVTDIEDIDSDIQKVKGISYWHEKVCRVLSKLGIKKETNSEKQDEDMVSFKTMIELIRAIRGKKLLPLTYIPKDPNNKNIADDTTPKTEQKIGGDRQGANSIAKQDNNDDAGKRTAAAATTAQEITDEAGAKTAANDIFSALAGSEDARYVELEKLLEFAKDDKVKEQFQGLAEEKQGETETENSKIENIETAGYEQINTEQNKSETEDKQNNTEGKHIKRSVLRNWVVDIYRDHDSLNNTLEHSKTAIDELNVIASVIVLVVIIGVWLLFMEFLTTKLLVFLSSQLLLVVFMFGNTVKTVFEAVIFVFLVHPFDVGDRCVVDGVQMVVEEMNILTTTFLRYDGEKIYYPNTVLAFKPISNFYRSPPSMGDSVEFAINLRTPTKTIDKLKEEIKTYLKSNPRRWKADHSVQFKEIEDVNKMKVALYVTHTINFQNAAKRGKRRSDLVLQMKGIFEELEIEYHLLPQQVNIISSGGSITSAVSLPGKQSYF